MSQTFSSGVLSPFLENWKCCLSTKKNTKCRLLPPIIFPCFPLYCPFENLASSQCQSIKSICGLFIYISASASELCVVYRFLKKFFLLFLSSSPRCSCNKARTTHMRNKNNFFLIIQTILSFFKEIERQTLESDS